MFTASCKADYPPEVVDRNQNPIINQSEIYSGVYAYVNVEFFPYLFGGAKKGIGCSLGPVMKVRDGEPLGGSAPTAAQAFGNISGPQAATPAYGAAQPAAPGAAGYSSAQSLGVNPITGLPL